MAQRPKIKITIPNTADVINDLYLPLVTEQPETLKTIVVEEGGRGSGKSRAIAQTIVLSALKRKMRIALVRKVADTIRDSSYAEIKDVVHAWGLDAHFRFYESPLKIVCRTGSTIICKGLDKAEKTKSLASVDLIWVEEATELTHNDYSTLSLTLRGKTTFELPKRIIISFNRQSGNWTEQEFFYANGQFKDNPLTYHQRRPEDQLPSFAQAAWLVDDDPPHWHNNDQGLIIPPLHITIPSTFNLSAASLGKRCSL